MSKWASRVMEDEHTTESGRDSVAAQNPPSFRPLKHKNIGSDDPRCTAKPSESFRCIQGTRTAGQVLSVNF